MNEYDDTLEIEQSTFHQCAFDKIDDDLLKYGTDYELNPFISQAEESGDKRLAKLYKILKKVCSLQLQPESRLQPYKCLGRESISELFTNNDFQVLSEARDYISCNALRARISDLRWLYKKPKSIDDAHAAIDLYASYVIDEDSWLDCVKDYYERAVRLSLQLGRGAADKLEKLKVNLVSALSESYPESRFMKLRLAELLDLIHQDEAEAREIAKNFTLIAQALAKQNDHYSARHYLEYVSAKYKEIEDSAGWVKTRIAIADSWEREASIRNEAFVKLTFFQNSIQAYRMIPKEDRDAYGIDKKISELRLKLRDAGRATVAGLAPISIQKPDTTDITEASIRHVSGKKNLDLALLYFCGIYSGVSKTKSTESASEALKVGILAQLFSMTHLSPDGRIIGRDTPLALSTQDASEGGFTPQVIEDADMEAKLAVESQILPCLEIINEEHEVTLRQLEAMCSVCPLIPERRAGLFAKGLYFGFQFDFASAIHLLVPQWEHMVRTFLKESDVHTSTLNPDGTDMECGLSTLLEKKEAEEMFDDDLLFEMIAFLTHKRGPNLRNEIAHGLLDDYRARTHSVIYWWWRSLKWVMYSLYPSE